MRQIENRAGAAGLRRGAVGVAVLAQGRQRQIRPAGSRQVDDVIVVIWLVVIDDLLSSSDRSARFSVVSAVGLDRSAVLGLQDRIVGGVRQQRTELREVDDAAHAVRGEGRPPGRVARQLAEIHLAARLRVDVEAVETGRAGQGRQVRQVDDRSRAGGLDGSSRRWSPYRSSPGAGPGRAAACGEVRTVDGRGAERGERRPGAGGGECRPACDRRRAVDLGAARVDRQRAAGDRQRVAGGSSGGCRPTRSRRTGW